MRKILAVLVAIASLALAAPAEADQGERHDGGFPDVINLPDGFFPEGIAIRGETFYAGSLADGSIYRGSLRTGEGAVLTDPVGPFSTVGLTIDRWGRVWAAGGPSGTGRVYDGRSGELLATYEFTEPFGSFVNDVIISGGKAYFTDSGTRNDPDPAIFQFAGEPRLFVVDLGRRGALPDSFETLPLDAPDIAFPNLNGIERGRRHGQLVVAHTSGGQIFRVDARTGASTSIDIGVDLVGADGLARRGNRLYVVENALTRVTEIKLSRGDRRGEVTATFPVEGAEAPTTVAFFGRDVLYAVDARFQSMTGPYNAYRIELRNR